MSTSIGIWQVLIFLLVVAIQVIPFWKIFPRAGWSPWLSLLMVVPLLNLVMLYILAFKSWPTDTYTRDTF